MNITYYLTPFATKASNFTWTMPYIWWLALLTKYTPKQSNRCRYNVKYLYIRPYRVTSVTST